MEDHCQWNGKRRRLEEKLEESERFLLHELLFDHDASINRDANKTAVIFDNGKGEEEKLCYQGLEQGANLVKISLEKILDNPGGGRQQEFIGVQCEQGILYPILILGILQSGNAFYNIDSDNLEGSVEDGVNLLGMNYILTNSDNVIGVAGTCQLEKVAIRECLAFQVFKVTSRIPKRRKVSKENFAYAIQTSGTTGRKKTVLVPHACICPNINDFVEITWRVTDRDVIFGSAPPTFDPHVVELFSALAVGAAIVYTTPQVKLNGSLLANLLTTHHVTILPTTPSLFRRLSISQAMGILRLVVFGGEKCPEKAELLEASSKFPNRSLTFQNVYGVTEVSCWASVSNIDLSSPGPVTIGNALRETEITLDAEGEIVISSETRHCVIIDASSTTDLSSHSHHYRTGDLGVSTPAGIVFQGRKDRVVKRNGMKVSLHRMELMIYSTGMVSYAECKLHQGKIYLMVKLKPEYDINSFDDNQTMSMLPAAIGSKLELPLFMYPDYIISLRGNDVPLNGNGKMDVDFIIKSFLSCSGNDSITVEVTREQVVNSLVPVWRSCTRVASGCEGDILLENFIAVGGTSISAARFVESTFASLKLFGSEEHQKWEQDLLRYLLDGGTFGGIVESVLKIFSESNRAISTSVSSLDMDLLPESQDVLPRNVVVESIPWSGFELDLQHDDSDGLAVFRPLEPDDKKLSTVILSPPEPCDFFTFPLGLCVDASPEKVPSKDQFIVGCHGGILVCVDLDVLRRNPATPKQAIAWKRKFPNRIEAAVEIHPNALFAYFGCHDGNFYKISVDTGQVACWRPCGGQVAVRSKCAVYNDLVIFVNSINSIECVDSDALNMRWRLDTFKILATVSPVIFRGRCLLPTLNKGIVSLDATSGTVFWTTTTISPPFHLIYSSPTLAFVRKAAKRRRDALIVCTSHDGIEAREPSSGNLRWRHQSPSSSSNRVLQPLFNECCNNLVWIANDDALGSYRLHILEPGTGDILGMRHISHSDPITPGLVYAEKDCHLCYKSCGAEREKGKTCPVLAFVGLHEIRPTSSKSGEADSFVVTREWKMETTVDFETFSMPTVCSEFLAFGGRDNNLHIVQMKV